MRAHAFVPETPAPYRDSVKSIVNAATALALTGVAWGTGFIWAALLRDWTGPRVALALGLLAGYGLVGFLAIRGPVRTAYEALGLEGFRARYLLPLLLLVPAFLPGLQVQAAARGLLGGSSAAGTYEWGAHLASADSATDLALSVIVLCLIAPLTAEWFFRGVLHERLFSMFGATAAFIGATLLYAITVAGMRSPATVWITVFLSAGIWGSILVAVRLATGSVLACALLHTAMNLLYLVLLLNRNRLALPGVTAPAASFSPPGVASFMLAAICVVLGIGALAFFARGRDSGLRKPASSA